MKKLFLKDGNHFDVELLAAQQVIILHDFDGNRIASINGRDSTVLILQKSLKWYELKATAEIIQNFTQYFNLLNQ